jgi:hypothetical protein
METTQRPHFLPKAAIARLGEAKAILEQIKQWQDVDGQSDFPYGALQKYDDYTKLFCDAGFLREVKVTEGGLRFRITWKGLCFLDVIDLFDRVSSQKFTDEEALPAIIAAFSFH